MYILYTMVHHDSHRKLNCISRGLSDENHLSDNVDIFMSIIYMFLQIAPLNTSIITVRTFERLFSSVNSNMFPQFVSCHESLVTVLTYKWFITSVSLHMNSQSSGGFEALGTNRTYKVKFSRMNFLSYVFKYKFGENFL